MKRKQFKDRKGVFINVEEPTWEAFQEICDTDRESTSLKINEILAKYVKEHGSGNPQYSLDQWKLNMDFMVTPAFFETVHKWMRYVNDIDDPKEIKKLEDKLSQISRLVEHRKQEIGWIEVWRKDRLSGDEIQDLINKSRRRD